MEKVEMSRILPISRYRKGTLKPDLDSVVREVPVTLFLNGSEFVTLVCSPGSLEELVAGFLYAEGILKEKSDLQEITMNEEEGLIWVETAGAAVPEEMFLKRFITTCCGRGRASFYFINDARGAGPVSSALNITPQEIFALCSELEERSFLFRETGGAHGAALGEKDRLIFFYADVGRHNAVDKLFGRCFLDGITAAGKVLVLSGRISSEILIKAAKMGIPVVVSRSAPTDLAVELAGELGITVVGFAREERLNIYTHAGRVVSP